ncbi:UDP-3-O-(3-hydroxymyristoyl)glucosamine N-acyltransferase [Niabella pedocola]|uniref:UDP-3-O-(3-hydroxymyristoyl)glucosamine N-acyltransferase n=1 Tax=Niabella pedocola TaxID=1752077 RepID=A0ABS8PRY2_9BACT|nr:UDP-3-O-(3-hydroxymyristoyl)glucosamine N-acyltransferase [Niabella pedocola]MCD2423836.1 UDP-3-O-(3-hydroxymyristoyl)glucosamine N-acyltransferase [Niabella pedocola]
MRFENPVPLSEIATLIAARVVGDSGAKATGINEIHQVEKGDLVFVDHPKYYDTSIHSAASYIIINAEREVPEGKALLIVEEPFEAYLKIVSAFRPFRPSMDAVAATATVGPGTVIMPNVYLGNHVTVGSNCVIYPNVTIMDYCTIGDDVVIQSGTVIGSDAFYYNKKTNRPIHYKRMVSCGTVEIETGVEIGAGCTIDRGVTGVTRIGAGTKMDNLVHIGHDTLVGKNCLFAAQVGIAGASVIEDEVILWGQVGVSKTLTIGKNTVVNAQSGVPSSLEGGKVYFGSPAVPAREKMKELVWIKRIPQMWDQLNKSESSS